MRTFGDGISSITSYIGNVSSGSKYRARAGTLFSIEFYSGSVGSLRGYGISDMPSC